MRNESGTAADNWEHNLSSVIQIVHMLVVTNLVKLLMWPSFVCPVTSYRHRRPEDEPDVRIADQTADRTHPR